MSNDTVPVGLALIVCDNIHVDPSSGKKTLLGLFATISSSDYPLTLTYACVYTAITDCFGAEYLVFRIIDVNEERPPVYEIVNESHPEDVTPLTVVEMDFQIFDAVFPEPGEYRFQLLSDNNIVIERKVLALPPTGTSFPGDDHEE